MAYADLVIENKSRAVDRLYTYETDLDLRVGQVVRVPFGQHGGLARAYVFRTDVTPDPGIRKFRKVREIVEGVSLTEEMVETASWMRIRYGIRYIDAVRCFVPPGRPPKDGREKMPYPDLEMEEEDPPALTGEQDSAVRRIESAMDGQKTSRFLLHGVTSSGKTEVYLRAAAHALEAGRTVIMLVPEIALAKQAVERFAARFGREEIAVLHSKLTQRERYDEWTRLRTGRARICVGARAGVFAPLDDIGVIILDEEHAATYKSDQTPKYETVDIAVKRLLAHRGVLILGSATPSVVSYERAREGIYELIEMKERFNRTALPSVELVDMREEMKTGNRSSFSRRLDQAMRETIRQGKQVILFQNRRGFSTYASCESCGEALRCPDCGISLVYHKNASSLVCHYCGRHFPVPEVCPSCGGRIRYHGTGTEKIEEETRTRFPDASCERLDLDTAKSTRSISRILNAFSKGKTRILIGTQLVAKGLDFENVGLVGVVSADASLNIPDYRSAEQTFQLVTQVAGRAGRGGEQGHVIVQTSQPESFVLQAAKAHDYQAFFRREIQIRRFMDYPPFTDLISATFVSDSEEDAEQSALQCQAFLVKRDLPDASKIFPPRISPYFRGQGDVRCSLLIKAPRGSRGRYVQALRSFGDYLYAGGGPNLIIDVNPYSTL